jgi:OHCU decarboxylase
VNGGLIPISDLNALSEGEFIAALQPLFEAADPLARALYAARPFGSYAELLDVAEARAQALPRTEKIEVVNAHPRIGENRGLVSSQSYREQGYDAERAGAQLDQVYAHLRALNDEYERRFGFRFVVFVNRRPKSAIAEVIEQRMTNSADEELGTALADMMRIARDRLAHSA